MQVIMLIFCSPVSVQKVHLESLWGASSNTLVVLWGKVYAVLNIS